MKSNLENQIIQKLQDQKTWHEVVPGSEWIKVHCLAGTHEDAKPSCGINVESGIWNCFSCSAKGMFLEETEENAEDLWTQRYKNLKHTKHLGDVQEAFDIMNERNYDLHLPPVDHMVEESWRGLSAELVQQLGIYYSSRGKYKGRYVLPVYDPLGRLESFDARIVDATARVTGAKYLRPKGAPIKRMVYPQQIFALRKLDTTHIIITEGPLDALSYIELGFAAICSFGLTPPDQERINRMLAIGTQYVTLAYDNDEPGINGMLKVLPYYEAWFTITDHRIVNLVNSSGYKDANEFLTNFRRLS